MNRAQKARQESGFRAMVSRYAPRRTYYELTAPFLDGSTGKDSYGTEYRRESNGQIRRVGDKVRDMRQRADRDQVPTNLQQPNLQGHGDEQL